MMQEFVQQVMENIDGAIRGVHTCLPDKIVSFDAGKGLATVAPTMKFKKPDGSKMDFPQVTGVPVVFPQVMGQNATIAYPIKAGDGCLILVAEQSIDYWMYGQETDTDLAFDLSNAICIPGLFVPANATMKEACDKSAVIVNVSGTKLTVKGGLIQMDAAEVIINGNATVNGNFTTKGGVVNLN